ncbi:MAG: sulfatase-like hydrolase/transferase [Bacteroidales bacterium]|nr:sulfatase-like hydrolase/transferase [Bacteroidales bacterium]
MLYLSTYFTLIKRILFLLLIYTISRFGFFFFNLGWFGSMGFFDVLTAFLKGILFDLKTILIINLPFIIFSLLPFGFIFKKWYQKTLKIYFLVTNLIPLFFNIADYEYSKFIGKRSDISLFGVRNDIVEQLGQMAADFWYLLLIGVISGIILWIFYPLRTRKLYRIKPAYVLPVFIIFGGFVFLGMRGSLRVKPLLPVAAYGGSPERANLMLNTPFCIIHTLDKEPLKAVDYFSDEELEKHLPVPYTRSDTNRLGNNILIIIVESLSPEFVGHLNNTEGYTPFLDTLADRGISFRYCFSNGRTSQQAVPSILIGIPQLMDESISTSQYQTNHFFSLAEHLKQFGYHSWFFHGGNNGTMGFDTFTKKVGFTYFGADEYPDKRDHDGSWGIYDGPYLKYCAGMLDKLPKPFFGAIFTLSSHQPYLIPDDLREKFNRSKNPAQNVMAYTDYSIKGFFKEAEKTDWFKNTLFIITADHTHPHIEHKYQGYIDGYRIPMIICHPSLKLTADTDKIVQQIDILPTIADFLGIDPAGLPRFGRSVLQDDTNRNALFYAHHSCYLVRKDHYLEMLDGDFRFKDWHDNPVESPPASAEDENLLKAYRQYFNNSMVNNSFVK